MNAIITHTDGIIYPTEIVGYESERQSANVAHPVPGRAGSDYTLRPARLRVGTLVLLFADTPEATAEEASLAAELAHAQAQALTLTTAALDSILMTYVLRDGGSLKRRFDTETRKTWTVEVDFEEIP